MPSYCDRLNVRQFYPSEAHTDPLYRSKAAADGAVIWAAKLVVIGRVTRVAYGTAKRTAYEPSNPEHQGRKAYMYPEGPKVIWCWSEIVAKVDEFVDILIGPVGQANFCTLGSFFEHPRVGSAQILDGTEA